MKRISDCEEQVMITVWHSTETPALKEILDSTNSRFNRNWKPQTVSTFLHRLVVKGYLKTERKGRYIFYTPEVTMMQYRKERMKEILKNLYDGDCTLAREDVNKIEKDNGICL